METENNTPVSFDHVPTAQELEELYMRSGENDPRSLFYKRVLVRPKPPVGWLLCELALIVGVCILSFRGMGYVTELLAVKIAVCAVSGLLTFLLLCKQMLIHGVKLYQAWAPEKLRKRCRYEPSCSVYMLQAVEKYGLWAGMTKGLKRWKGCKPPNGGYDLP
ncbi:MAG: membrane protein insertion efficiency factor YidD [Oscillospiraceae bacterium]|nr:membrane protein insertion efficiency factor YidD [Oscillospiraceae bacterium]